MAEVTEKIDRRNFQGTLARCSEIEQRVGRIYRQLAGGSTVHPDLRDILLRLADDEDEHKRQIELARRLFREDIAEGSRISPDELDARERWLATLEEGIRRSAVTQGEVIVIARKIERMLLGIHADKAIKFKDDAGKALFGLLADCEREHLARVEEAAQRFSGVGQRERMG